MWVKYKPVYQPARAGFFFALGTYVGSRIIGYLLTDGRPNKSDLDGLVLLEHAVNLLNAPVIVIQFLREGKERVCEREREKGSQMRSTVESYNIHPLSSSNSNYLSGFLLRCLS